VTGTFAAMVAVPFDAPAAVGENTTLIVQVDAAARVAVQVPPAAPAGLAYGPVKVAPKTVAPAAPVLLSVRVCAALVEPIAWLPNASDVGVTLSAGARPVPLNATGEPVTVTFAVMVAVPVAAPAAVGENTTLIVQVDAAARSPVQVPPAEPVGLKNGPVKTTGMPVAVVPPVLLSVRVWAALVVPTVWAPNASDVGFTASTAGVVAVWVTNSTAPMSMWVELPVSGRGLPKKSVAGAEPLGNASGSGMALMAGEPAASE
jgi:hypothetical protein